MVAILPVSERSTLPPLRNVCGQTRALRTRPIAGRRRVRRRRRQASIFVLGPFGPARSRDYAGHAAGEKLQQHRSADRAERPVDGATDHGEDQAER